MLQNFQTKFSNTLLEFVFYKEKILRLFEIALLINGHILIEDLPGVGKTTFSKAFSKAMGKKFSRIQGTSDLLPSDILGGETVNLQTKEISLKKGPIFAEIVLIDEVNRMHPKTQSAFLEAMEEKSVSLAGKKFSLPKDHMILATQNPIEHEGTNILPEAQRDRFACKISLGFPPKDFQQKMVQGILGNINEKIEKISPIFSKDEIEKFREKISEVTISDEIATRIVEFFDWTRTDPQFRYGVSPRGMIIFSQALKANAFLEGRNFVIPEDGIGLLSAFLSHRIEFVENIPEQEIIRVLEKKYRGVF